QARVRDQHAEHECDADRDTQTGEQLAGGMSSQPAPVQVEHEARTHAEDAWIAESVHGICVRVVALGRPPGCAPSYRRPSRNVQALWLKPCASASCVTSSPGISRSRQRSRSKPSISRVRTESR